MIKILVTGGCGFVGRNLIKKLLENSNNLVVCVDSLEPFTGCKHPSEWPEFSPLDFSNFEFRHMDCRLFFANDLSYFDEVFHLAAMVGGRLMIENNPLAVGEDLSIDSLMFSWCLKSKVKKVINFSSSAAYPVEFQRYNSYRLLKETDINLEDDRIGMPDLSYGWAKLTCEFLGKLAYERHGIQSVVYRPFSGYGPTQDDTYPFPSIIKRGLSFNSTKEKEFFVWGSGNQMRDFIHIEDCIKGVLLTKDKIVDGSALNLSTGRLTSFKEFASIVLDELGIDGVNVIGTSDKPEGVFARGGDTSKQIELGFEYEIDFRHGIRGSLDYLKSKI
jgi:nucleoside-diphosphate-sugar epimerase